MTPPAAAVRAIAEAPPTAPADRLRQLAATVRQLLPDRRRPEQFHEQKDAVEKALRKIACELENNT